LSNLFESLGSGQTVDFLRIEIAKAHPQDFFDVAESAPEEIVGSRGVEDINGCFWVPLWARPRWVRVWPAQYGDKLLLFAEVVMPDVMKESDFFEELAILVACPDDAQGFLRAQGKADLVSDVVVGLGNIGDKGVRRLNPRIDRSVDRLAGCVVTVPRDELCFGRGG